MKLERNHWILIVVGAIAVVSISIVFLFSANPICLREGISEVYTCSDGSFRAIYGNIGGGYDIIKQDGSVVNCPVINPDLLDEDCFNYLETCTETNICPI